jgi:NADH-quinone oxidoreductase subunit N
MFLNFDAYYFNKIGFIIIILNSIIYLISLIVFFNLLFLIDTNLFKTLNEFKGLMQTNFMSILCVFSFISLAGLPPFLGFIGKFFMFLFIFNKCNFLFFFVFFYLIVL